MAPNAVVSMPALHGPVPHDTTKCLHGAGRGTVGVPVLGAAVGTSVVGVTVVGAIVGAGVGTQQTSVAPAASFPPNLTYSLLQQNSHSHLPPKPNRFFITA